MQQDRRRMAGKFYVIPFEVHDLLDEMKPACRTIYTTILRHVFIEEEGWDQPDEKWVSGVFRVESGHLLVWSGISKRHFYRCWGELIEAKLVEIVRNVNNAANGSQPRSYSLPHFKKKADVGLTVEEIKQLASRQDYLQDELDRIIELLGPTLGDTQGVKTDIDGSKPTDSQRSGTDFKGSKSRSGGSNTRSGGSPRARVSDFSPPREDTDHSLMEIVNAFYASVGQEKISDEKRKKGIGFAKELRKEGFTPEQIAFAAQWTVKNAKETPYEFAMIKHTIGQALAARKKEEAASQALEKQDEKIREEEQKRKEEEREAEKIEGIKLSMGEEDRSELRAQAIEELKKSGAKESFINKIVIGVKENEILRRRIETSSPE